MFRKILIANRGEIACRVIRTARELGIETVAVYSDADRNALHVQMADEAIHIGAAPASESYLQIDKIIAAAKTCDAKGIHPGYGFLSENAAFAKACAENDLVFIGPPVSAINAMGSKSAAKRIMADAGVPLVPGYHGEDQDPARLHREADAMGYPVLLKATAGGGGKGMRQVWSSSEFESALDAAKRESSASFGDDNMLVEKYLTRPRHVEIQVFCDRQGNSLYLAERDCSLQRRHQKVIEEAPAPAMDDATRIAMGETAVTAAKAIQYEGAGTVEFLLDEDGSFYFMEMNTRLQVEHPVTEMVTGLDLVEWQLRVACGEPLPITQSEVVISGHAFEARIYAEDPDEDFLPATGTLHFLQAPPSSEHVRVDTGVRQGDSISVYYDPMIAKLIVWDSDRDRALQRLAQALANYCVGGTVTNLPFLQSLANHEAFANAELSTGFIETHKESLLGSTKTRLDDLPVAALVLALSQQSATSLSNNNDPYSPWSTNSSWRLNEDPVFLFDILFAGDSHSVSVQPLSSGFRVQAENIDTIINGSLTQNVLEYEHEGHRQRAALAQIDEAFTLFIPGGPLHFSLASPDTGELETGGNDGALQAPMNGTIVTLLAAVGDVVEAGAPLLVMEAMKMEHTLFAPTNGTVNGFYFSSGDLVDGGAQLVDFQPANE